MRKITRRKTIRRRMIRTISGGNISWPYINKRERLIVGKGKRIKRQRGGFIAPIVAALPPAAIKLVSKLFRYNGMKRSNSHA